MLKRILALGMALMVVIPSVAANAQDSGSTTMDCNVAYRDSLLSWMLYLRGDGSPPPPVDPGSPCLAEVLQAQSDAIATQRQATAPTAVAAPENNSAPTGAQDPSSISTTTSGGILCSDSPRLVPLQGLSHPTVSDSTQLVRFGSQMAAAPACAIEAGNDYVALLVGILNRGTAAGNAFRQIALQDDRGRKYQNLSATDFPGYFELVRQLQSTPALSAQGLNVISHITDVQPGRNAFALFIFQVAPDSQSLRLVSAR